MDTYAPSAQQDSAPPKFIVGEDDKASSQAHSLDGSSISTPSSSRSSSSAQLRAPNHVNNDSDIAKDDTDRTPMVRDRSATSSPSPLTKAQTPSMPSSLSPRFEESRLTARAATPLSLGAMSSFNNLDTPKRVQSGSSIMSLGSTTVEDSSMLRSVYRSRRHGSVSDLERGLLDSYVTLHMSIQGKSNLQGIC